MKRTILLVVLVPALLVGQTPALPFQPLGPDDLVSLTVSNSQELTHQFRVAPDGMLRLPFLADPITATGRYPEQVESDIRSALKTQKIFVRPVVSLAVAEYASRPVTVMGAVRRPVTFQATASTTLLDALARAEGLAPEAGSTILVTRPDGSPGRAKETRIDVQQLLGGTQLAGNLRLHGGEQIRVPDAPRVYVLGSVRRACTVAVKDPDETTVLRVLTQAEGLAPFSSSEGIIYRRHADGRNEITVPVKRILKGKSPDVLMEPYDILYIPEAKGKRLTVDVIERMVGFGSSTASAYLVFR